MQINDDHDFGGPRTSLKLLAPGEQFLFPDYHIPQSDADAVAAELSAHQDPPKCVVCHSFRSAYSAPSAVMPTDIDAMAHHMWTK